MLFAIALGGAAGSLARYGIGLYGARASTGFPFATLAINVAVIDGSISRFGFAVMSKCEPVEPSATTLGA